MVESIPSVDVWTQVGLALHQRAECRRQAQRASGRMQDAWCVFLHISVCLFCPCFQLAFGAVNSCVALYYEC